MRSFSNIMPNFAGYLHLLVDSICMFLCIFIVILFYFSSETCNFASGNNANHKRE